MEKRLYRRYPLAFPVSVQIPLGGRDSVAETECVEVSRSGLTLSCDAALIEALLEQAQYPPTFTLGFTLTGCPSYFEIDCHLVRHRRLSRQQFHLVALFRHFRRGDGEVLSAHLMDSDPADSAWPRAGSRGAARSLTHPD